MAELGVLTLVMVSLEVVARLFAPPEDRDPRLGVVAFWISALIVALVTHFAWPLLQRRNNWLELVLGGLWLAAWVAWKVGIFGSPSRSPRQHEQIWAVTVGSLLGVAIHHFMTGSVV